MNKTREPKIYPPGQPIIGISVSFCIEDLIRGRVREEDVVKIIGSTKCGTVEEWAKVIDNYRKGFWFENPDEAERLFRKFLAEGKIEQPRLKNNHHYPAVQGIKGDVWFLTEEEIPWSDSELNLRNGNPFLRK